MKGKTTKTIATLIILGLGSPVFAAGGQAHWSYEGHDGPTHWSGMCQEGKHQSPIDISNATPAKLDGIRFDYRTSPKEIVNNGHTIQVNMHEGSSIHVGGKTYKLLQFHFHSPSEHTINGKAADMVAHFVHQADDGQLGVIGATMVKGKANSTLTELWKHLPPSAGEKHALSGKLRISTLLPGNKAYYNYSGSLTTPPCSEGVNWMVLQHSIEISAEQVAAFTGIFDNSVRPVQPLNGRMISASK